MEKEARGKEIAYTVATLVAAQLLGTAMWNAASAGKEQLDRSVNMRRHWEKLRNQYPEELGGENTDLNKRNFEAIYRVAPTLAKIPQITIHYLRQAKDYATGGFDPSTIETLAKTEAAVTGTRQRMGAPIKELSPDSKSIADLLASSPIATLPLGPGSLG